MGVYRGVHYDAAPDNFGKWHYYVFNRKNELIAAGINFDTQADAQAAVQTEIDNYIGG